MVENTVPPNVFSREKNVAIMSYLYVEDFRGTCPKLWNPRLGRKIKIPSLKKNGRQAIQTLR